MQDADRVPAGPRAVGVGLRPRRHRPRGLAGCSPRCRRETARSAMVGPAKCMVKLRCAWSRWRAGAMRQGHEALAVSLSHSRSVLAPAHLRGGTSSRVSHRVCGPRCRQVALLLGVCLVTAIYILVRLRARIIELFVRLVRAMGPHVPVVECSIVCRRATLT